MLENVPLCVWHIVRLRLSDMGFGSLMRRAFFYDRLGGHQVSTEYLQSIYKVSTKYLQSIYKVSTLLY